MGEPTEEDGSGNEEGGAGEGVPSSEQIAWGVVAKTMAREESGEQGRGKHEDRVHTTMEACIISEMRGIKQGSIDDTSRIADWRIHGIITEGNSLLDK